MVTTRRSHGDGGLHWDETRQRWIATVTTGYTPTGGSWGQIKKLLGIPRGRVDHLEGDAVTPYRVRRMRVFRR